CSRVVGSLNDRFSLCVLQAGHTIYEQDLTTLRDYWSDVTKRIQTLRDNPDCAASEHELRLDPDDPGLSPHVPFQLQPSAFSLLATAARPRVAIRREQGANGHTELGAVFHRAGFESIDVHMTDILSGRASLADFKGLVACGGFSYGDVLGAGEGWAKSILF